MTHMTRRMSAKRRFFGTIAALFCAAAYVAGPAAALAFNWRIQPAESEIVFEYQEDGAPAAGRFTRFEGVAEFDRRRPERARLTLKIDVDSIALSDNFRSEFVKNETWFDEKSFPQAVYVLRSLTLAEGADPRADTLRYIAEGDLTIKGRTKRLTTSFELDLDSGRARARGRLAFNRFDFNVGDRVGGLFVDIGDEVAVAFDLAAKRL